MRKQQVKFYTDILKEGEFLLLKSSDSYFGTHYESSPLSVITNFKGTAGEAIIDKSGHITIFVDTRYHILVDKQVYPDIETVKIGLGESFFDAFKKRYKKGTILHVSSDIALFEYLKLDKYFDLRTYKLPKKFLKNTELDISSPLFICSKKVAKKTFLYNVNKLKSIFQNADNLLIFNLDQISYLTNIRSFQFKNSSLFRSILFIDFKTKNHTLFVDILPDIKISGLKFEKLLNFKSVIKSINSPIYLNYKDITLENFLSVKKPKEIKGSNLSLISSIKTKSEIDYIEACANKLDKAIFNFKKSIKAGISEYNLSKIFENELLKTGAKDLSFKTILAFGENSASIHYSSPSKDVLLKNESIILLDCGGYWKNGYATDITRTFYFGSNPLPIYKKVYTYVLKAFINCFASKETDAKKLDKLARKILMPLEKDGFYFNHGLGHGIGTSVHQNPPVLSMVSSDIIKPYQTHSIEPGLYGGHEIKFGVRLENCVWFDLDYNRYSLTKFPFEEVLIDYSILNKSEKDFLECWQSGFKKER